MKIKRRINNNVVLATGIGAGRTEGVIIGKGLGFKAHPGDIIKKNLVQTIYVPSGQRNLQQMAAELGNADEKDISLTYKIVKFIEKQIGKTTGEGLFFGLLDHLTFTFQRYNQGISIKSPLDWEIKNFYPNIYKIGLKVVKFINDERKISLPSSEAAFISLHVINNVENLISIDTTIDWLQVSKDVNLLIRINSNKRIDQQTISYKRFNKHLRYLVLRLASKETVPTTTNNEPLMQMIIEQYPIEYKISKKISQYLTKKFNSKVSEDEYLYLTLHLVQLLN